MSGQGPRFFRSLRAPKRARRGLSILETMLAIAILGGTLAALGELVRVGTRAAERCQEITLGQMLCENLVNECVIGMRPLAASSGSFPDYPDWQYSVDVQPVSEQGGLVAVIATVAHPDGSPNPFSYQLMRWTIDPMLKYPPEEEELTEEEAESV